MGRRHLLSISPQTRVASASAGLQGCRGKAFVARRASEAHCRGCARGDRGQGKVRATRRCRSQVLARTAAARRSRQADARPRPGARSPRGASQHLSCQGVTPRRPARESGPIRSHKVDEKGGFGAELRPVNKQHDGFLPPPPSLVHGARALLCFGLVWLLFVFVFFQLQLNGFPRFLVSLCFSSPWVTLPVPWELL